MKHSCFELYLNGSQNVIFILGVQLVPVVHFVLGALLKGNTILGKKLVFNIK